MKKKKQCWVRFLLDNKRERSDLFTKFDTFKKLQEGGHPSRSAHSACAATAVMVPNIPSVCGIFQELFAIGWAFGKWFKNNKKTEAYKNNLLNGSFQPGSNTNTNTHRKTNFRKTNDFWTTSTCQGTGPQDFLRLFCLALPSMIQPTVSEGHLLMGCVCWRILLCFKYNVHFKNVLELRRILRWWQQWHNFLISPNPYITTSRTIR